MDKSTIFLDIDGVMATVKQYSLNPNAKTWLKDYNIYPFDIGCVMVLNDILKVTDSDIVVSSDWRNEYTLKELCDIFAINGVIKAPVGITPTFPTDASNYTKTRSEEILRYMEENYLSHWIAIDDEDMYYWLGDHFFLCKSDFEGIKQSGLKQKIIKYLIS